MKILISLIIPFSIGFLTNLHATQASDNLNKQSESGKCSSCHEREHSDWHSSHHYLAMLPPTNEAVLGDFSGKSLVVDGINYTFALSTNNEHIVTVGKGNKTESFKVKYTFGAIPLQQYLVEADSGKLQALPVAWDSRPKSEGGQNWFHLMPDEHIAEFDRLDWKGPLFNWNGMCADCHSSGLKRNFDVNTASFNSTFDEINVSCMSCHGDGRKHVEIRNLKLNNKAPALDTGELDTLISLAKPISGVWRFAEGAQTASLSSTDKNLSVAEIKQQRQQEIGMCAACHSRRTSLTDGFSPRDKFLDAFEPTLLQAPHYYHDGQIKDEVYVYGSFLQSKMHEKGVTCSDCHNPHSLETKLPGNLLCATCHDASVFDSTKHHHHKDESAGAQCVNCHMPETTYMVVDPRRDHSIRIPRPDLTESLGSPNACNGCHSDKSSSWATSKIKSWGGSLPTTKHYGFAFKALSENHPDAQNLVTEQLTRKDLPDLVRASLLSHLGIIQNEWSFNTLVKELNNPSDLVRLGALKGINSFPVEYTTAYISPLLESETKVLRTEAARLLSPLQTSNNVSSLNESPQFKSALLELIEIADINSWRGEGLINKGILHTQSSDLSQAIKSYQTSIKIDPAFAPAYINLADLYRHQQQQEQSLEILELGLNRIPKDADINHAMGLYWVRQKDYDTALKHLKDAADVAIENPQYQYVYAVALNSTNNSMIALQHILKALNFHKNDVRLLNLGLEISLSLNKKKVAIRLGNKLLELVDDNPQLEALLKSLK